MEIITFDSILRVPFVLLRIAGIYQVEGSSKAYRVFGAAFHIFGIDVYVLCQLIFILSADNLLELSDSLSVFFTYVMLCYKSFIYAISIDSMLTLIKDFEGMISLMQSITDRRMAKLQSRLRHVQLFFRVFYGSCMSACVLGALVPVTTYIINPNPPYQNPYKTWFPYDFKNEFGWFVFVASYQGLNAMFYCGVVASMDTFPVLCLNVGAGLLEELGDCLSRLGSAIEDGKRNVDDNLRLLERYIALHIRIKRLIRRAEKVFSPMIFAQGAVSLVILCTGAYSLSEISPAKDFTQAAFILVYLCPMVLQIFLPCYFGNEISLASENLSTSLFHSEWYREKTKFRVAMKMFMENTKNRILVVAADGFFHVNLTQFLRILNLTYSLYALLQRMN